MNIIEMMMINELNLLRLMIVEILILDHQYRIYQNLMFRFRVRRQSSVDLRILEEWKTSYDGLKVHANWPSIVQKLMIRRHLRRQRLGKDYRSLRKQSIP